MPWSKVSSLLDRQRHRLGITREESMAPGTTVIVPLYIYPEPGAWNPLHESIQKHHNTHFLVIVNPGNGPGPGPVPDANYVYEIPRLTAYPNVDVVGYVHTTFAQRDISAVKNDVGTYSRWKKQANYPGLGINGIFVDETPNQHDTRAEEYLRGLTEFAKSCDGFTGKNLVIYNPGCAPSPAYMALADITVVFEDTWQTFDRRRKDGVFDLHGLLGAVTPSDDGKTGREKLAIMIHSIPKDLKLDQVKAVAKQARETAHALFITDLSVNYYSNWSSKWTDWVKMIATE